MAEGCQPLSASTPQAFSCMVATMAAVAAARCESMSAPDVLTVASGSGVPPAIIKSLLRAGPQARPIEHNLARLPSLFIPERAAVQPSMGLDVDGPWKAAPAVMYKRPINIKWARPLSVREQFFIGNVTNRWVREGCKSDYEVAIPSWAEAAWELGYNFNRSHGPSGNMRQAVIEACEDIRAVTITSAVMFGNEVRGHQIWGIFDKAFIPREERGSVRITLTSDYAELVQQGVSFANEDTHRRLVNRDQVAARVWTFWEAEQGPAQREGFRYHLFGYEPGGPLRESWVPAIADLAGLHNHAAERACRDHGRESCPVCFPSIKWHRREVAGRIRKMLGRIIDEDSRYEPTELLTLKETGMWDVNAKRVRAIRRPRLDTRDHDSASAPPTIQRPRDHDSASAPEHDITHSYTNKKRTNSDSFDLSLSLTATDPIASALLKHFRRHSSKRVQRVREIAKERSIGTDEEVARILLEEWRGPKDRDLFVFLKEWRKQPRLARLPCEKCDTIALLPWSAPRPWLCDSCRSAA